MWIQMSNHKIEIILKWTLLSLLIMPVFSDFDIINETLSLGDYKGIGDNVLKNTEEMKDKFSDYGEKSLSDLNKEWDIFKNGTAKEAGDTVEYMNQWLRDK